MLASLRIAALAALLAGLLGLTAPAQAQTKDAFPVDDQGGFFSKEAIASANKTIARIKRDYHKDLLIETMKEAPAKILKADKAEQTKLFDQYAAERYKARRVSGIYVLLTKEPKKIEVFTGSETRKKAFTKEDRKQAFEDLASHFKKDEFDKGLTTLAENVEKTLDINVGKTRETGRTGSAVSTNPARTGDTRSNVWGWVCMALVAVLGIWLVIGLVRAFTSGGGGGGGGGMGGGGYGGGGGSFFPSLMGGLFGAAAGMWLYDSFMRPHGPSDWGGSAYGNTPSSPDDGAAGGEGTGGDWGNDDAAGGDGGGGDWGGGGDGGGGDWGGGGDMGGGGGGDW